MSDTYPVFVIVAALAVAVVVIGVIELAPEDPGVTHSTFRPALHAGLNGTCAALLLLGFWMIRHRKKTAHMVCMILAGLVTLTFLASYLHYHSYAGSTKFMGQGLIRPVYFVMLISHTVLAAIVAPLAGSLFWYAARRKWARHRKIAKWTLPVWIYTSITGVLIYFMLHVWFVP